MTTDSDCPNKDEHTPCPDGYVERSEWFAKMGKTHKQTKCPDCGRFAIWIPKKGRAWSAAKTFE